MGYTGRGDGRIGDKPIYPSSFPFLSDLALWLIDDRPECSEPWFEIMNMAIEYLDDDKC